MKKIIWFIKQIINYIIKKIISLFFKCSNGSIVIEAQLGHKKDYFAHNTKYLLLYLISQDSNVIFLCEDTKIRQLLIEQLGYFKIYSRKNIKHLWSIINSKHWLYDWGADNVSPFLSSGSNRINLWHGIPLKKIEFDMDINPYKKLVNWQWKIFNFFRNKDNFYIVNSEYEKSCYETAFLAKPEQIKILGSPRLDVLLHDIPHSDLFMEEDFAAIKGFKEQGKKLFFYTPTFRDTGNDISGWLKSEKLHNFLRENNAILVCKLHVADKNSLDFDLPKEFYKMNSDSDIYPVLKYSDALITDYSSIAYDYLLLDKPIIYHVPDLEEYQETCRGFYVPYSEFAVGEITKNEIEIINAIQNVVNGVDNFKEQRKVLRDKMFKYQDGHNCERVVEWIKSLG